MNIDSAVPIIGDVAVILQLFPSYVTIKHGLGYGFNAIEDGCYKNGWRSINCWIKLHILRVNKWVEAVYFLIWMQYHIIIGDRINQRRRPTGVSTQASSDLPELATDNIYHIQTDVDLQK